MSVYILLADGFEEAEALVPADILRRAGADVKLTSTNSELSVKGAHNICVTADILTEQLDMNELEALILPGGAGGTAKLAASEQVREIILKAAERGSYIAAICAAPSILGSMGLLDGRKAACYPSFQKYLEGSVITGNPVEHDDIFITAQAAGSSFDFAFVLTELLFGREEAEKIKNSIYYK